jgi:ankyrin repeat protein
MYRVAHHNDIKAVRLLMDAGARIHHSDNYMHSAVNSAAFHGSHSLLQWFAKSGFDYSASKTGNNRPPFHSAAASCDLSTMKFLVKLGANPLALGKEGWSALHLFVVEFSAKEKSRGKDVVPVDDIVRYLVRACGIDPNKKTSDGGITALHIASENGLVPVVSALLGNRTDLNSVDSLGKSYRFSSLLVKSVPNVHSLSKSDSFRTF